MKLNDQPSGFMLLQSAVVLGLIVLIIGLTMGNMGWFNRCLVRAQVEKLQAICCYLQQMAITTHEPQTLYFDLVRQGYRYNNSFMPLCSGVSFGVLAQAKGPPSQPTHFINTPIHCDNQHMKFYSDGTIQAGTIYLIDRDKTCMYALTSNVGAVCHLRLYYYDKQWTMLA